MPIFLHMQKAGFLMMQHNIVGVTFFLTIIQLSAGIYSSGNTNLQLKLPSPFNDLLYRGKKLNPAIFARQVC